MTVVNIQLILIVPLGVGYENISKTIRFPYSVFLDVSFLLLVFPFPAPSGTDRSKIASISGRTGYDRLWIVYSNGDNEMELTKGVECVSDFS